MDITGELSSCWGSPVALARRAVETPDGHRSNVVRERESRATVGVPPKNGKETRVWQSKELWNGVAEAGLQAGHG